MEILQTLIIVLFCICSALLILFVMLQSGKGGGLNLVGGGNTGMQPQTMDTITKITWVTGVIFFVLAILAAIAFADAGPKSIDEPAEDDTELPLPLQSNSTDKTGSKSSDTATSTSDQPASESQSQNSGGKTEDTSVPAKPAQ